jgi:hypothetical protein
MAIIELGGDHPTEATVDQSDLANNEDLEMQVRDENTNLTITNTENSNNVVDFVQEIWLPYESVYNVQVTLAENVHVYLGSVRQGDAAAKGSSMNYKLGEGSTLEVNLETEYERPNADYNVDMGEGASTFVYHHFIREGYGTPVDMNLTNVTANDQIRVPGATRIDYSNGELKFYGYDYENNFEELYISFPAEGLDPDQIHFENGTVTYACYLKGTHIATPEGELKVEELKAGDKVKTATGGINTVKWIGFRKLNRNQLPAEHALRASPICICKDAFAENVPHRDLTVSPGHRFNFDGALVPALSLVNGLTITQDFDVQRFEYYHVELEKFDILLAEGAAAESYLEVGSNRNSFQNARTVTAHPDFGPAPKNVMLAQYVQKITREIIEPIRRNLFKRAEILTGARRTADSGLHIMINGQTIHSQTPCKKKGLYRFELHAGIQGDIRILSNAAVVRETSLIDRADTRVIGVGLAGVALITNDQRCEIDLDDSALNGFHQAQEMDGISMRWTLGEAIIPARLLCASKDPVAIELNVLRTHMYWISVEQERAREAV